VHCNKGFQGIPEFRGPRRRDLLRTARSYLQSIQFARHFPASNESITERYRGSHRAR
jgi:hypothetical protein